MFNQNFTSLFFLGGGSKITEDGNCSHEKMKRCLLLGRKAMTNLDSILKSRDISLPTKVHLVKGMVLPEVIYGCESWTIKKAEHQRIAAFELWCWRRLLRGPWTARRDNQSILREISPGCSLEGLMLKLKLQYFGHLMRRANSLEKTLMLGKIEGRRRRGQQRMMVGWHHRLYGCWVWASSGSWWWTGKPGGLQSMGLQRVGHDWVTELNLPLYSLVPLLYLKVTELFLFPSCNSAPIMRSDSLPELASQGIPALEPQWCHRPASPHCPEQDVTGSAWVSVGISAYIWKELFKKKRWLCDRDHM